MNHPALDAEGRHRSYRKEALSEDSVCFPHEWRTQLSHRLNVRRKHEWLQMLQQLVGAA